MFTSAAKPAPLARVLCLVVLALLLVGCGKQDLYEPPGAPFTVVGRLSLPSEGEGVAYLGHYAYVAGAEAGLHVVDIADPAHPVMVQTINTVKYAERVETVRTFANQTLYDMALVVEGTEGITTYNITDPPNTESFNQGTTAIDGNKLFIVEPDDPDEPFHVYLAESWKGIRVFESSPEFPGLINYFGVFSGTLGYALGIAVKDGYAYVADNEMGLVVMDVRELVYGSVQVVSSCDTDNHAEDVVIIDDYAYVADGEGGLVVFRINGPDEPVKVADLDMNGYNKAIVARDNLVCIAAAGAGVHFVDITNPANPIFMGSIVTGYANDLTLTDDGYVLVADSDDGLLVLGGHAPFQDTTAPAKVTSLTAIPYSTESVRLSWFATGDDRFLGQASSYEIRYADSAITDEASWTAATVVAEPPTPVDPCTEQDFIVDGLTRGGTYHFAIKIVDDTDHSSTLSNSVEVTTYSSIVLRNPSLDIDFGVTDDTFTYSVTYLYGTEPTTAEITLDGSDTFDLTYVSGEFGTGALYQYQTNLDQGEHSYSFSFAASDGETADTDDATGPTVGHIAFLMGSLDTEPGRDGDEQLHGVLLSDSVLAQPHEVTQAEWQTAGMTLHPGFVGGDVPVHSITWLQAVEYCNAVSTGGLTAAYTIDGESVTWNHDADGWRLPTEAEWEWLCRAGTETAFVGGEITETGTGSDPVLDDLGWYIGNTVSGPRPVGAKDANAYGLYDMHGNVWEYCWDWYASYSATAVLDPTGPPQGQSHVIRGGCWYYAARDCRSASRGFYYPSSLDDTVGFRVVRTIFDD